MSERKSKRFIDHFTPENVDRIHGIMTIKKIKAGNYLFHDPDFTNNLYLILKGRMQLTKITSEGLKLIFAVKQEGDLVETSAFFGTRYRTSFVLPLLDCTVGVIRYDDLEALWHRHPDLAIPFMRWMTLEQRIAQSKMRDLMLYGKVGALYSVLIRLSNSHGTQTDEGIRIHLKLTHQDLANFIGATRESVNRILGDLKRKGILSMTQGHILIHDLQHLKDSIQCENCPIDICVF